jgi:hypothetical protein
MDWRLPSVSCIPFTGTLFSRSTAISEALTRSVTRASAPADDHPEPSFFAITCGAAFMIRWPSGYRPVRITFCSMERSWTLTSPLPAGYG